MADYLSEMLHDILCNDRLPVFGQPQEIGTFSHDEKDKFFSDKSQLKFYSPPGICVIKI